MRDPHDVQWVDEWVKAAKPKRRLNPDDDGLFPRILSTSTAQYNMRQIPQRGMAEMLQAYRTDPWFHLALDKIGRRFASISWNLYYRASKQNPQKWLNPLPLSVRGLKRFEVWRKALDTGELQPIEEHPLLDLLHKPNPLMSGVARRDLDCKYLDTQGECFNLKRRDAFGIVYELWPITPTWIFRVPTQDHQFFDVSVLGRTMRVAAEDMIWMKHPELLNPYTRGAGQGESLGSVIDTNHYAMEFQKAFFYNDARPNMFIYMAGAQQDQVLDVQNRLENGHRGSLRKHRPLIYGGPGQMEIEQIDLSKGIDSSVPLLKYNRDMFLSVLGVPPEIAGVLTNSNRSTIDAAEDIMAREVIVPRCEFYLDELTRQLVPEFDDRLLLGYDNPVPADRSFQLQVLQAAPWIADVGEWREMAGLPSRGDQDDFYMVPNLVTPTPDASQPVRNPNAPGGKVEQAQTGTTDIGPGIDNGFADEDLQSGVPPDKESEDDGAGKAESSSKKGFIAKADGGDESTPKSVNEILQALQPKPLTNRLLPIWLKQIEAWGNDAMDQVGVTPSFDMTNPLVEDHLKNFAGERLNDINDTTRGSLRSTLAEGFQAGEGIPDLARRVSDVFDKARGFRARNISRTEVMRSSNFATLQGYKMTKLVPRKEWVATPDDRTRDEHAELGTKPPIGIDDNFEIGDYSAPAPGQFGEPELDCNCLIGTIEIEGDYCAATRRLYQGPLIELYTATGRRVTMTINHKVLTPVGFVAAKDLYVGATVLCDSSNIQFTSPREKIDNPPTQIQQIFESLAISSSVRTGRVATKNFDGEQVGGYSNIDVVGADCILRRDAFDILQQGKQLPFVFTDANALVQKLCVSTESFLTQRTFSPSRSVPSGPTLSDNSFLALFKGSPFQRFRFGSSAHIDASRFKMTDQRLPDDAGFLADLRQRFSANILADQVVKIRYQETSSYQYVYDLQGRGGFIIGNGIFLSNCRCTLAPIVDADDDPNASSGKARAAYHMKLWKKFDRRASKWEGQAMDALHDGFTEQEDAILTRLKKVVKS